MHRSDRDADTNTQSHRNLTNIEWKSNRIDQSLSQYRCIRRSPNIDLQHNEFIPANTSHCVGGPHRLAQSPSNSFQDEITSSMSELIIDRLEPVEIETMYCQHLAAPNPRKSASKSITE